MPNTSCLCPPQPALPFQAPHMLLAWHARGIPLSSTPRPLSMICYERRVHHILRAGRITPTAKSMSSVYVLQPTTIKKNSCGLICLAIMCRGPSLLSDYSPSYVLLTVPSVPGRLPDLNILASPTTYALSITEALDFFARVFSFRCHHPSHTLGQCRHL